MILDSSRCFETTLKLPLCIKGFLIVYFILILAYTGVDESLFKPLWYGVAQGTIIFICHALLLLFASPIGIKHPDISI